MRGNDCGRNDRKCNFLIVRLNNLSGGAVSGAYMGYRGCHYAGIRAYLCGAFYPFPEIRRCICIPFKVFGKDRKGG